MLRYVCAYINVSMANIYIYGEINCYDGISFIGTPFIEREF